LLLANNSSFKINLIYLIIKNLTVFSNNNFEKKQKKLKFFCLPADNEYGEKVKNGNLLKGKPSERRGRKASGLSPPGADMVAEPLD
jgi:hypothetical protein